MLLSSPIIFILNWFLGGNLCIAGSLCKYYIILVSPIEAFMFLLRVYRGEVANLIVSSTLLFSIYRFEYWIFKWIVFTNVIYVLTNVGTMWIMWESTRSSPTIYVYFLSVFLFVLDMWNTVMVNTILRSEIIRFVKERYD